MYQIVIPKNGPKVGQIVYEGLDQHKECHELQHRAAAIGTVLEVRELNHGEDDAPVHDSVNVQS